MIPVDDEFPTEDVAACRRKVSACFDEVAEILDGDPGWAKALFLDFVKNIKLPREPRRRKPNSQRDAKLLTDYEAAKRGTRDSILLEFEACHNLAKGSAIKIIRRYRQHSAPRVFAAYITQMTTQRDG